MRGLCQEVWNQYTVLRDVLDRISRGWPGDRVDELLPDAWAAANASIPG